MYGEGVMEVMVVKINERFRAVWKKSFFDLKLAILMVGYTEDLFL